MNNYLFDQSNLSIEAFVAKSEEFTHDVKLKEYLFPEKSCDGFFEVICGRLNELEFSENKNFDSLFGEIPDCKFVIKSLNILGEYYPDRQHIKYYLQDPDILKIVKIHERFHAIHHLTIDKNNHIWKNFADVDSFYKELLAQLFTYIYIRDYDNALLSGFENLNRSQPFIYQTFKIFQNYDQQQAEDLYWLIRRNNKRKPIFKALDCISRMINHNSNKTTTMVASTSTFKRNISTNLISKLQAEPLYSVLHADIDNGNVFPAIRNNQIDFYYKGGNLFKFNERDGFRTNIKYAAVIAKGKSDYLTEKELVNFSLATEFSTNYQRIKENCAIYAGIEANGVSKIYHKHSYINRMSGIMVLDIEISLKSDDPTKKQDRIDIL